MTNTTNTPTPAASRTPRARRDAHHVPPTRDAPVSTFDLMAEAQALREQATFGARGHNAKTLVKEADLRVVLIVMRAGARLHEHKADHLVSVQALSGRVQLNLPAQTVDLPAGKILILDKSIPHDVVAHEDSAILLSLTWKSAKHPWANGFDALHAEHQRFHKLLDLLEVQVGRFHRDEHPDYDLIHDIFFYLTSYPDRLHHAIEDRAYAKLAERVPEAAADVAELARQHRAIAQSGARFLDNLDAALNGVILTRAAVELPALEYITLYREHMQFEEQRLLPLGRTHLLAHDWAEIRASIETGDDPLFGEQTEERFRALHRQIASDADCSCSTDT